MHDRDADVARARIVAARGGSRRIAARQHADGRFTPKTQRRCLAVADIEPEEEPALRPVKPESAGERGIGNVEFASVAGAVLLDMRLVAPQCRRRGLDRQRHLTAAIIAQVLEMSDQGWIAGDEPGAQPGRARPLRERMKYDDVVEQAVLPWSKRRAGFERPRWRRPVPDLGVTFVDREHEIVLPG